MLCEVEAYGNIVVVKRYLWFFGIDGWKINLVRSRPKNPPLRGVSTNTKDGKLRRANERTMSLPYLERLLLSDARRRSFVTDKASRKDSNAQEGIEERRKEVSASLSIPEDWTGLTKEQTFRAILYFQKLSPATSSQIAEWGHLSIEQLNQRLRKNYHSLEELRYSDILLLRRLEEEPLPSHETPIISGDRYEYGIQRSDLFPEGEMEYLRFYSFLMVDFDHKNLAEIRSKLSPHGRFRIYETHSGYHAFLVTEAVHYLSGRCDAILGSVGCDEYYRIFARWRGYKVRLSRKKDREEPYLARFVETTTGEQEINQKLLVLASLHDKVVSRKQESCYNEGFLL